MSGISVISATLAESDKDTHYEPQRIMQGINSAVTFRAEDLRNADSAAKSFSEYERQARQDVLTEIVNNDIFVMKGGKQAQEDFKRAMLGTKSSKGMIETEGSISLDPDNLHYVNQTELSKIIRKYTAGRGIYTFKLPDQHGVIKNDIAVRTVDMMAVSDADDLVLNNGHNDKGINLNRRLFTSME